jgi:hypothetical protein
VTLIRARTAVLRLAPTVVPVQKELDVPSFSSGTAAQYSQTPAPGYADGHIPSHEEGNSAEHRLLGHALLVSELLAQAMGEIQVVGHSVRNVHPCGK